MSFSHNNPGPGNEAAGEPSMEEILASIRRILKDEAGKSPPAVEKEDEDILVLDASMIAKPVDLSTATSPPASLPGESRATPLQSTAAPLHFASEPALVSPPYTPEAAPERDLVLDQPADPASFKSASFKPASLGPPPIAAVFGGRSLDDYPVLKPEPSAPVPDVTITAPVEPEPTPETTPEPIPETITTPAPPEPATATTPLETDMPETHDNLTPPAGLVSDQATNAAASSIGSMLRNLTAEKSVGISRTALTIEDVVREEIRPLLKAWLDTNLPGLVERVVRSEIEKVIERSAT